MARMRDIGSMASVVISRGMSWALRAPTDQSSWSRRSIERSAREISGCLENMVEGSE